MEKLQNATDVQHPLKSDLADFYGTEVEKGEELAGLRIGLDRAVTDSLDITLREYDYIYEGWLLDGLSYGPASAPTTFYPSAWFFKNCNTFQRMMSFYHGFAYDKMKFRITCSAPKGLAGGFFVGVYPEQHWGESHNAKTAYFSTNFMTRQYLTTSPETVLVCYGESKDVEIEVPWQLNAPHVTRQMISTLTDTTNQPWPGMPVLWILDAGSRYLSSVSMPATIRIFVTFDNLRFIAPAVVAQVGPEKGDSNSPIQQPFEDREVPDYDWSPDTMEDFLFGLLNPAINHQDMVDLHLWRTNAFYDMGWDGPPVDAEPQAEVVTAASVGTEILSSLVELLGPKNPDGEDKGRYDNPEAVQLSYVGDSTRRCPATVTPALWDFGLKGNKHPVSKYITKPQYIANYVTPVNVSIYSNPTCPRGTVNLYGNDQNCTFLRFFAQLNAYWRGTLYFDFVVMGHPMVEVEYKLTLEYPPWSVGLSTAFSQNSVLRGICNGVKKISVPVPFITQKDYIEVIDSTIATDSAIRAYSSGLIKFQCNVVSTAMDAAPLIPITVFMRAADDFHFYQPIPPGYSNVVEAQVKLPQDETVFETRARVQEPLDNMLCMINVEDYMEIWSRALPFGAYESNGEPQVEARWATSPFWFPMNDSNAFVVGAQNSWYVTNDYISFLSSMFLFYKGTISLKILCAPGTGYRYVSLDTGTYLRQFAHNPFTATPDQLPNQANFGFGTVATNISQQPVLEMTLPFRSTFEWAPTNPLTFDVVQQAWFRNPTMVAQIKTNVTLHEELGDLKDALYRKIGPDFVLEVEGLLPPPSLWITKGNNWS